MRRRGRAELECPLWRKVLFPGTRGGASGFLHQVGRLASRPLHYARAIFQSPATLRGGAGVGGVAGGRGAITRLRRGTRGAIVPSALVEPAEQLARDHDALHFGRSLVDLRDLGIAVVAFCRELRRVPVAAEDLQALV